MFTLGSAFGVEYSLGWRRLLLNVICGLMVLPLQRVHIDVNSVTEAPVFADRRHCDVHIAGMVLSLHCNAFNLMSLLWLGFLSLQIAAIVMYILLGFVSGSYVTNFVVVVLLLMADFWVVSAALLGGADAFLTLKKWNEWHERNDMTWMTWKKWITTLVEDSAVQPISAT